MLLPFEPLEGAIEFAETDLSLSELAGAGAGARESPASSSTTAGADAKVDGRASA